MNLRLFIFAFAFVLTGCAGTIGSQSQSSQPSNLNLPAEEATQEQSGAQAPGAYIEYEPGKLEALKELWPVALFFYTDQCSSCKKLDKDINAQLESIPSATAIVKVNSETEEALKQQYGVTVQNMLIFLDKMGNEVSRSTELSASEIMAKLQEL